MINNPDDLLIELAAVCSVDIELPRTAHQYMSCVHFDNVTLNSVFVSSPNRQGYLAHLIDSNSIDIPNPPNSIWLQVILYR